jgi:protein TonB
LHIILACVFAQEHDPIRSPSTTKPDTLTQDERLENLDLVLPKRPDSGSDGSVALGMVEKRPSPIFIPKPEYPTMARKGEIFGIAVVKALIEVDGSVLKVEIHKSSGSEILDGTALDCARRALFSPAVQYGRQVRVWVSIPFDFRLRDKVTWP